MNSFSASHRHPCLWFQRGNHRFAVSMDHLQEVLPVETLRPLPAAEPALVGLFTLREWVVPVFDPLSLAGQPAEPLPKPIVVVVGIQGRPVFGLLAESVGKVIELEEPGPLQLAVRLPEVFQGQSGKVGLMVFDSEALAARMGLIENPAAVTA